MSKNDLEKSALSETPKPRLIDFENDVIQFTGEVIPRGGEGPTTLTQMGPLAIADFIKQGFGTEVNKTEGTKYVGQFENDRHHGHGVLTYEQTGDFYDGAWVEGNIEGEGKFSFSNGDVFEGSFAAN